MCVLVCVYVCVYVCMCLYVWGMRVCVYMCMCVYVCVSVSRAHVNESIALQVAASHAADLAAGDERIGGALDRPGEAGARRELGRGALPFYTEGISVVWHTQVVSVCLCLCVCVSVFMCVRVFVCSYVRVCVTVCQCISMSVCLCV